MTTSLSLPQADFDSLKQSLKIYLANQGQFADFNFEGSNISAVMDVLAYNTYIRNFYYNMAVNETFRDSAKLRQNVVARAQENGYVARSFTSATAVVNFAVKSTNLGRSSVVIPKGTPITSRIDNKNFTFVTLEPTTTTITETTANTITFSASNVRVAEGFIVGDSYVVDSSSDLFEITNEQVDTSSIEVTVIEDQQTAIAYTKAESVIGVDTESKVFFLRVAPTGKYAIHFGDGITGVRPKDGSIVVIEYRVSNGQLPNGAFIFKPGSDIDGENGVTITTVSGAMGGDVYESIESIRFNGTQANITQRRSVYESDYKNDITQQFPYIVDVNVVGGEDVTPPQYGRVVITAVVDDEMNPSSQQIEELTTFIRARSPLTIRPVFQKANIIRIGVSTKIKHQKTKSWDYIKSVVAAAIDAYSLETLQKFNRSAIKSKLIGTIDDVDTSIIGNSTSLTVISKTSTNVATTIDFANAITSVNSSVFLYKGASSRVIDDGDGALYIISNQTGERSLTTSVGTVNYTTGIVTLTVTDTYNQSFDIIGQPLEDDIVAAPNMILKIDQSDVIIQ